LEALWAVVPTAAPSETTTTEVAFSAQAAANPTWALQAAPAIPATLASAPTSLEVAAAAAAAEPLVKVVALISMVEGAKSLHPRDLVAVHGNPGALKNWQRAFGIADGGAHQERHFIVITFLTKISL
jgi:hypothetical protein